MRIYMYIYSSTRGRRRAQQIGRMSQYLIEVVVDLAAVDTLRHQRLNGVPWHLLWRQVGATQRHAVHPDVERVARAAQVRLVELVALAPAERRVAEAFLHDGVEPGEQEVEARALVRRLSIERNKRINDRCDVTTSRWQQRQFMHDKLSAIATEI